MYKYTLNYTEQMYAATKAILPCFTVTLKEEIDGNTLAEAVQRALSYHPHFKTQLIKEDGLFKLVENERKPIVKESAWSDEIRYGGEDYNFFPWVITYTGKQIVFSAYHCLTDGGGTLCFLFAVTRQYLELQGVKFETEIGLVAPENVERTMDNMFEVNANPTVQGLPKPDLGEASPLPPEFYETDSAKISTYRISLKLPDVKKLSMESETSNFTVVAYVIAKAMERAMGKSEGIVNIRIPVSLRGTFKSISDRKSIIIPHLCYDIKLMGGLRRKMVETIFKSQLFLLSDKVNAIEGCNQMVESTQNLMAHPEKLDEMAKAFDEGCNAMNAGISYSQATNAHSFGEMAQYMENYGAYHFPQCMRYMEIIGNTFGGWINLSISQSSKNDILVKKITEVLTEEAIRFEFEKMETHGIMRPV